MKKDIEITRTVISRVVHEVISNMLPAVPQGRITAEVNIKDLGADSIERVEIILTVMTRLRISQSLSSFSDIPNIGSLIDYLCTIQQK